MALPEVSLDGPAEKVPAVRDRRADRSGPTTRSAGPTLRPDPVRTASDEGPDLPGSEDRTHPRTTDRVSVLDRVLRLLRYFADQIADATRRAGAIGSVADARPESWNQFRARVDARAWVPEDYDGKFLIVVPTVFYYTVGAAGWGLGNGIQWLCTHMFAFCTAFLLVAAAITLWLIFS